MGENVKGSCGYVAIGQILSYYDTYLSDEVIPEEYDAPSYGTEYGMIERNESPGIVNDTIQKEDLDEYGRDNASQLTAQEYYNIVEKYSAYSLHSKLITMGKKAGYYKFSDNKNPCSLTFAQSVNIMKKYLSEQSYVNNTDYNLYSKSSGTSSSIKSQVKKYIDMGLPVFAFVINSGSNLGHFCVAYDYDDNNIYANMGWGAGYAHASIESHYNTFKACFALKMNIEHSHSNNYIVLTKPVNQSNWKNNYYCWHDSKINVLTHRYTDRYEYIDNEYHYAYCTCGYKIKEGHTNGIVPVNSVNSSFRCTKCGAQVNLQTQ